MSSAAKFVLKLILSLALLVSFFLGLRRIVYYDDDFKCEMTYMFEYPQYIEIDLARDVANLFPRYGLYVYGEGQLADKYYKKKFKGLPVLFFPGNAGSYKQVRSLASVAYRKVLESRRPYRFDFFAIDFDEELAALHGGLLERQATFARHCIKRILELYGNPHSSVLLIGHSMGGMIAKAVLVGPNGDLTIAPDRIQAIITLATPHKSPVAVIDEVMADFYRRVERHWSSSSDQPNVTVASIGGAVKDIQVRSGLTVAGLPAVNVLTTEIPGAWVSTDHLCIVWCKQVVKALVRSLFDMVDPSTMQWTASRAHRMDVLSYHLINRYGGKSLEGSRQTEDVIFDPDGRWREAIAPRFAASHDPKDVQHSSNTYFMIPLLDNAHRNALSAVASGLNVKHWVFGCSALAWHNSVRYCERGTDLSPLSSHLPDMGDHIKRKTVNLDLADLRQRYGFTHVVFSIPKSYPKATVQIDVHRSDNHNLLVRFPVFDYVPFIFPVLADFTAVSIPAESLTYNLTLPDLKRAWQSLFVAVSARCPDKGSHHFPALVRKVVPWSREGQYYMTNRSFEVQLHSPKTNADEEAVHLQLINPAGQCGYDITIGPDWTGTWAQLIRFYGPLLFPLVSAVFLHCLAAQLRARSDRSPVPSTLSCLFRLPVIRLALVSEAAAFLFDSLDSSHFPWWPFPASDHRLLRSDGLYFPLVHLILAGIAWVWALLLAVLFSLGVSLGGHTLHSFVLRYLRGSLGVSSIIAEAVTMALSRIPIAISVVLLGIGLATCGSLALFLGLVVCIWKLFDYYEDELESMLNDEENQEAEDGFNINNTVALMWTCSALLSLPALVVWVRNPHLAGSTFDHTILPGAVWSIFGMVILQKSDFIRPECAISYRHVACLVTILAFLVPSYGLVSLYRVHYFLQAALVAYASRQLM